MRSLFGLELPPAVEYILAFAIILALLGLFALGLKRFSGPKIKIPGHGSGRARQSRLGIVDIYDLDRQRQLVLLRRDNVEHLLMIGGGSDVVIEQNISRLQKQASPTPAFEDQQVSPSFVIEREEISASETRVVRPPESLVPQPEIVKAKPIPAPAPKAPVEKQGSAGLIDESLLKDLEEQLKQVNPKTLPVAQPAPAQPQAPLPSSPPQVAQPQPASPSSPPQVRRHAPPPPVIEVRAKPAPVQEEIKVSDTGREQPQPKPPEPKAPAPAITDDVAEQIEKALRSSQPAQPGRPAPKPAPAPPTLRPRLGPAPSEAKPAPQLRPTLSPAADQLQAPEPVPPPNERVVMDKPAGQPPLPRRAPIREADARNVSEADAAEAPVPSATPAPIARTVAPMPEPSDEQPHQEAEKVDNKLAKGKKTSQSDADDPFSLSAIEQEFERLLGRQSTKKDG